MNETNVSTRKERFSVISMIWAEALDGTIGVNNEIPWHVPEDFKYFKNTTLNSNVVMGRNTWESLPHKPLPGRRNIVLTSDQAYIAPGAETLLNGQEIIQRSQEFGENFWIMGGGKVYEFFMPYTDRIRLTKIGYENTDPSSVKAPKIDENLFRLNHQSYQSVSKKGLTYQFLEYLRI